MSVDISVIDVKEQVDTYYRTYALYVIQARGIPNFYDSLTPVQRLVLTHAPDRLESTIGLIGKVMATGLYHHGDASLGSAISRMARRFGCSEPLLEGSGFFGSPVTPRPASPRYTKVRSRKGISEVVWDNAALNEKNAEGGIDWLHVEVPVGLALNVVGIAVGYNSCILPRKLTDVTEYLDGNDKKKMYPYFAGFAGKVTRLEPNNGRSVWLVEGVTEVDEKAMTFRVKCLPPICKYETFLEKLHRTLESYGHQFKVDNDSKTEVDVVVRWKDRGTFKEMCAAVTKLTKVAVVERVVFVKDGNVIEYETVKDYLDEFRVHREVVRHRKLSYDILVESAELEFLRAKLEFLEFMLAKKRVNSEIAEFLGRYPRAIRTRLEAIKLTALTKEVVDQTRSAIADQVKKLESMRVRAVESKKVLKKLVAGFKSKGVVGLDLGESVELDLDGIETFAPVDEEEAAESEEDETD